MKSTKTTYFCRHKSDDTKGGGEKRVHQVFTALSNYVDLEVKSAYNEMGDAFKYKQQQLSDIPPPYLYYWSTTYFNACKALNNVASYWVSNMDNYAIGDFVIVDDPIYFIPLIDYLVSQKIPIVGCIQNIESLVPLQSQQEAKETLFQLELAYLKKCDAIIVISREDELLLNNFDIKNTFYFPYWPSKKVINRLLKIRERRKETTKEKLLLLGSMGNYPTREGAITIGNFFIAEKETISKENELIIAGFDAGSLNTTFKNNDTVELRESISNEALDDLLSTVKACICYQHQGTGALTKIPESLIAGVPILGNSVALRNYHNLIGTVNITNLEEIFDLIKHVDTLNEEGLPLAKSFIKNSLMQQVIENGKKANNTSKDKIASPVLKNEELEKVLTSRTVQNQKIQLEEYKQIIAEKENIIRENQKLSKEYENKSIRYKSQLGQYNSVLFLLKRILKESLNRIKDKITR